MNDDGYCISFHLKFDSLIFAFQKVQVIQDGHIESVCANHSASKSQVPFGIPVFVPLKIGFNVFVQKLYQIGKSTEMRRSMPVKTIVICAASPQRAIGIRMGKQFS